MTGVSLSGITETVFDYFKDCFFDFCVVLAIFQMQTQNSSRRFFGFKKQ